MFDSVEAALAEIYVTIEDGQANTAVEHEQMLEKLQHISDCCTEATLTLRAMCNFLGMPETYIIKAQNNSALQQPPPVVPSA